MLLTIISGLLFSFFFVLEEYQEHRLQTHIEKAQLFNEYVTSLNQATLGAMLAKEDDYIKGVLLIGQAQKNLKHSQQQFHKDKVKFSGFDKINTIGDHLSRFLNRYLTLLQKKQLSPNDPNLKTNLSRTLNAIISLNESIKIRHALFESQSISSIEQSKKTEERIYYLILLLILLLFFSAIFFAIYFTKKNTKRILDPIEKLINASGKIASGHFELTDVPQTNDEFGTLGKAFINMSKKIQSSQVELKNLASFDQLTKLPNRHFFSDYFDKALIKAKHANDELVLLLFNIDRFKKY